MSNTDNTNETISPKPIVAILIVFIFVASAAIFVLIKTRDNTTPDSNSPQNNQDELPVINPDSNTASRYFNIVGESDFLDFREDGLMGDFKLDVTHEDDSTLLEWDDAVKVHTITVYDMGRLDNLTDHTVVFSTTTVKEEGQNVIAVVINDYLKSPLELTTAQNNDSSDTQALQFKKGNRYSIEATGIKDEKLVWSAYTFTY